MSRVPFPTVHLSRARSWVDEAELRRRVLRALTELLAEELPPGARERLSQSQRRQYRQFPNGPAETEIRSYLERRTGRWPPEMLRYLFGHWREFFPFQQQQQQQQQIQQQEQQAQQQQQQQAQQQQQQIQQQSMGEYLFSVLAPALEQAGEQASLARLTLDTMEEVTAQAPGKDEASEPPAETVQFVVYGPGRVEAGTPFTLDLWAFLTTQRDKVEALAKRMGQEQAGNAAEGRIAQRSVLGLQLYSDALEIERPVRPLAWNGRERVESFGCNVKPGITSFQVEGRMVITCEGLLIAEIRFNVRMGTPEPSRTALQQTSTVPRAAFASYASANRIDVLRSVQGIRKGAPGLDIFVDVDAIRSGDDWREKLGAFIVTSDIFYLFWSEAAKQSEWVEREWRYALRQEGLRFIDPFPLESPEVVTPPAELSAIHFNDRYLMFILAQQQIDRLKGMEAH